MIHHPKLTYYEKFGEYLAEQKDTTEPLTDAQYRALLVIWCNKYNLDIATMGQAFQEIEGLLDLDATQPPPC